MPEKVNANYIDHISVAVYDVLEAEQDYCQIFGWDAAWRYVDEYTAINVSCFAVGLTTWELMEDMWSGGWYELQDLDGNVVTCGPGNKTKWVKKKTPQPEGKDDKVGNWLKKQGREGVQLISINVDDAVDATAKFKKNGGVPIPFGDKEVQYWDYANRNYTFLHPKKLHGIILEVIDGKYDYGCYLKK